MIYNYFNKILCFFIDLVHARKLIWQLAKKDFIANYLGSYLGLIWAFIQPITTIFVLWFVFSVGFKAGPTATGCPFILWLIAGMIPWFFLSDAVSQGVNSVIVYSYLVKKVVFRVSSLPMIKIASSLFVHFFLLCLLCLIFVVYGYYPNIYWLQIPYFITASVLLVLGLSWLLSAINVFVRDIGQIIVVIIQLGFWATPIFWDFKVVLDSHPKIAMILKLNPAFYIIEGYRGALINHTWFWQAHANVTWYFWCVTFLIIFFGAFVFKKLRPHFADVL